MKFIVESLTVLKRVYKNKNYLLLTTVVGVAFYLINGFILTIPNLKSFYQSLGLLETIKYSAVASLYAHINLLQFTLIGVIILSILVGIFISLLVYRIKMIKENIKVGFFGWVGIFLGMAAPGCAACGIGLISLIGISAIVAVLPFHGNEIIVIAIVAVLFSIFSLARKLYNPVCKLNSMDKKLKGGINGRNNNY